MTTFEEQYQDNIQLAHEELDKIDIILKNIDVWKETVYEEELFQLTRKIDDDMKTAMIVRALEKFGYRGLPEDNEVLLAMFEIIENSMILTLHMNNGGILLNADS